MTTTVGPVPGAEFGATADTPLWPRLLALAVVAQPVLLGFNAAFHPAVSLNGESLLAGADESATTWFTVHIVAALGAILGAPAAFGLRRLVRERGRRLADLGVAASLVAAIVLAMAFAAEASVLRLAVTADPGEASALALADAYTGTPEFFAVGVGLLAVLIAVVLLDVALLLDRRVPRWLPCTSLVATAVTFASPPGNPLAPVAFAVAAVAAVGLARRVADSSPRAARPMA